MFLSVFDLFKIGIGPSSSHTMGPMVAAGRFLDLVRALPSPPHGLKATLYGSLAHTGVGHATDRAVILGLAGFLPDDYDADAAAVQLARIDAVGEVTPPGLPPLAFAPATDLVFNKGAPLPGHPNGLEIAAFDQDGTPLLTETYYSIGGGFVVTAAEQDEIPADDPTTTPHPFPFEDAGTMLAMARESGKSIAEMKRANEEIHQSRAEVDAGLERIWTTMAACIARGLEGDGILPGGLGVKRRAGAIYIRLREEEGRNLATPHIANEWMSVYAMAVNEENAAGGQVVTAPTNGAAGVLPAVLRYWLDFVPGAQASQIPEFLLTAAAIAGIIKHNASISGAELGCQAEVGSAAAMAAAGLAAVMGGTPEQVENAAEIALEHHLGMTCDPVKGLVQVPCIERNGLGAIKAVSAAALALRGDGTHFVSLDRCVQAMLETGRDMSDRYKETSLGGLAVSVPNC